jgi:TonB family protein
MFDWYVGRKAEGKRRAGWVGTTVAASIAVHAAVAAALLLSAMWQIEKLDADFATRMQASIPGARLDPGPLPAAGEERRSEPRSEKKAARTRANALTPSDAEQEAGDGDGEDGGDGGGQGGGGGGDGSGGDGGCVSVTGCVVGPGTGELPLDLPPDDPCVRDPDRCKGPEVVPEKVLEGHRVAGETFIPAPEAVRQQMHRARVERITATLRICIDRRGEVAGVDLLRPSGHPEWDRRLARAARDWRYRPYRLEGGTPVAARGPVTLLYVMK